MCEVRLLNDSFLTAGEKGLGYIQTQAKLYTMFGLAYRGCVGEIPYVQLFRACGPLQINYRINKETVDVGSLDYFNFSS